MQTCCFCFAAVAAFCCAAVHAICVYYSCCLVKMIYTMLLIKIKTGIKSDMLYCCESSSPSLLHLLQECSIFVGHFPNNEVVVVNGGMLVLKAVVGADSR